jgi:signal transduction histidine kinase
MALVSAETDPSSRRRVFLVYVQHGVAGLLVLVGLTALRHDEPATVLAHLGPSAFALILFFFVFSAALALLKFNLTEEIFVSLAVTAYIAMVPLLGMVLSAWIAVGAAAVPRLLGNLKIGPIRIDREDLVGEWARTASLFATYGIPVAAAGWVFELSGGAAPLLHPSIANALRMTILGIVLVVTNNLIVFRVERALGYSVSTTIKTGIVDSSIYAITFPFAMLMTFAYAAIGWGGLLAAAFTWIIANYVTRTLAHVRVDREQLIQRLTSLTNIGKTISLNFSPEELLGQVYLECRNVIEVSMFSIALHDSSTNELSVELNIVDGERRGKLRFPAGQGLNGWVFQQGKPLLLGSSEEERRLGLSSYDDGVATESWLGVPMVTRDRVIGVISVQSFDRAKFSHDDVLLLTAIANQAAVAIENGHLYKDLEGLNIALEQRVSDRTNELREANLQLIAADRSKNQFLASMSHELRTPLNAIIGFSSILMNIASGLLPPRQFKMIENIRTAGNHLLALINDILDLAKIETGKLQLEVHPFDFQEMAATVDRVIRGMAAEREVTVITYIDDALRDATLDEIRVKQILLNLLSNAVKFSRPGGRVHLSAVPVPRANSPLARDSIRMMVKDDGIGIAPQDLEKIFDEFYQAPGRSHKGGTGLGLSLTRNFVTMHEGQIEVASEIGKGSTFIVHLPRRMETHA